MYANSFLEELLDGVGVLNTAEPGCCLEELADILENVGLSPFSPRVLKAHGTDKLSLLDYTKSVHALRQKRKRKKDPFPHHMPCAGTR